MLCAMLLINYLKKTLIMAKDQRINFTLSLTSDGRVNINMNLYPKMAKSEEIFRELPIRQQILQSAAAGIGKKVMKALAEEEQEKRNRQ